MPAPLPPTVAAAFSQLGENQRDIPEMLMVKAQQRMGGGVYCRLIEHVGDLTHRMSSLAGHGYSGWDMVGEKVTKLLYSLRSPYGFEREMNENFKNNARYNDMTVEAFRARLMPVLQAYAEAHRGLTVYNRCQWLAREAAVAAGTMNFTRCEQLLSGLETMLKSVETFDTEALTYTLSADGEPLPYEEARATAAPSPASPGRAAT